MCCGRKSQLLRNGSKIPTLIDSDFRSQAHENSCKLLISEVAPFVLKFALKSLDFYFTLKFSKIRTFVRKPIAQLHTLYSHLMMDEKFPSWRLLHFKACNFYPKLDDVLFDQIDSVMKSSTETAADYFVAHCTKLLKFG